jgi:hypothetical protein
MPPSARRGRGWVLLINTVILALLAGSALLAISGRGPSALRGGAQPGDVAGAPAIRPDLAGAVGVNLDPSELAAPDLPQRLAELAKSGVHWVRFRLPWDQIEPEPGQYRWEAWDRVMAALRDQPELQSLVVLDGAPAWARPPADAGNPLAPPQTRAHFGAFAAAVGRRYGPQIRYYQIWDEPNIAPHWGARAVDPAGYLGLLREGAANLRAVDADAQIVTAALAPNFEAGGANLADTTFLDTLYKHGGRAWFDIVAGQPYGFSQPPEARPGTQTLNFSRAALLRDVMVRHGDAGTPFWATAFGWNALPAGGTGQTSPWGQVSEAEQAQYAARALDLARGRWAWMGPLFWATDCPQVAAVGQQGGGAEAVRPVDDPWLGFSLCDATGARRPVWGALTGAGGAVQVLPPGDHALDHPALHYSPGWRVTPAGADPSATGDRLNFTFYGTDLALRVQGGPFWAYDRVTVDGRPANALPRDEQGAAYLVLSDPLAEVRTVKVARGLPPGEHQVVIEANGGWDQWALRGVVVEMARPGGLLAAWPLLALTVLAAISWVVVAWPWRRRAGGWLAGIEVWSAGRPPALIWGAAVLLGAAYLLSPRQALDWVLLAALAVLFLIRPETMLPLIAASIPLWPHPKPVVRWQFSSYELLIWVGAAAWALRWLLRWERAPRPAAAGRAPDRRGFRAWTAALAGRWGLGGLDWPVLALLVIALAATLGALRIGVALRELRMVFIDGALFYLLITRILDPCRGQPIDADGPGGRGLQHPLNPGPGSRFSVWPVVDGLLTGMLFVSGLALWQLGTGQGRIDVEGVWRVRGFYGSPNNLALVLDRAIPLALAVAFFASASGAMRLRRWLYGLAAVVLAAACIATFSKGVLLLGLPVSATVVIVGGAWRARRRWPLVLLAAAAALSAIVLVWLFQTPRFADLLNFQSGTSFIRVKLWQGAWQMALDHPWLGVGPDNFLYAYRTRYVLPSAWEELNLSHPHNLLLDLWTRLGLLGLVAGLWALFAALRGAWRLFRRGSLMVWPLALGLLGGLAATIGHGLIDNSLFLIDLMALFMLALGLIEVLSRRETPGR